MAENKNIVETTETKLERANRIAVQSTDTGYKADFYRTHKHLVTLLSCETGWEADEQANKSAQREDFRKFAIEHSADIGILWDPADKRADSNKRIPKYESDEILMEDAKALLMGDVETLTNKCPYGVTWLSLSADSITPVEYSAKGTDLSKLGIIDGKYERSGNWAWADVEMTLTLTKGGEILYYSTTCQLVSGQLKKPHITQTAFNESIKESLKEVGLWEEAKESDKDSKVEQEQVEEPKQEEVQAEEKPKTKKTRSKKAKTEDIAE